MNSGITMKGKVMANILLLVISNGFFFFIIYGYYQLFWDKYPKRHLLYIMGGMLLFGILNFAYYIFFSQEGIWEVVSMLGIAIILTFAAILQQTMERMVAIKEQMENYVVEQQNRYYARQFQEITRNEEETRRQRHELINNYLAISAMAKQGDTAGIAEFADRELQQLKHSSSLVHSGNMTVDAVLNYKLEKAQNMNIRMELNINIPTRLELNNIVVCGVLGNAMDNALDACSRVTEEKRFIRLNMNIEKKNLFLEVVNSFDGIIKTDRRGNIISRKAELDQHGFGMAVMRRLLEENNGNMDVKWDDRQFCLRIIAYHVL